MQLLDRYKARIEQKIESYSFGKVSLLSEACFYALKNGGKRFRPSIVYIIAEELGDLCVDRAALSVEFFHTASLIADDLPCMDNDAMRRGKPSLHAVYGQQTALLATYALIAAGYDCLRMGPQTALAIEQASKNTGILGATGGQFLDLMPMQVTEERLLEVLYLKTGALFELSFVLGWIFGGGDVGLLDPLKKAAYHFGLAFQIADDLDDWEQDRGKPYNFAHFAGKKRAKERVKLELEKTRYILNELRIPSLYKLTDLLSDFS